MALSLLSQTVRDMYDFTRPEIKSAVGIYDALVSDIQVNDWLVGARARVTTVAAPVGNPATVTMAITRHDGSVGTVTWLAASALRIQR